MSDRSIDDIIRYFASKYNVANPLQKQGTDDYVKMYIERNVPKEQQEHYKEMYKSLKKMI